VNCLFDPHTSKAKERLYKLIILAAFTCIGLANYLHFFSWILCVPIAATLPPASVDPEERYWTPLEGGRPLAGGGWGKTQQSRDEDWACPLRQIPPCRLWQGKTPWARYTVPGMDPGRAAPRAEWSRLGGQTRTLLPSMRPAAWQPFPHK
jgi:hypothetical protein